MNKTSQNTVTIQINGTPVNNARQVVLALRIEGNTAIQHVDYDKPLKFVFTGSKVVGSDILETLPRELKNSINHSTFIQVGTDSAELEKILLNPKDSITLTILLEGDYNQLDVSGRIIGGQIIKYVEGRFSKDTVSELMYEAIKIAIRNSFPFSIRRI